MKRVAYTEPSYEARLRELDRSPEIDQDMRRLVRGILQQVREQGDAAVVAITNQYTTAPITRGTMALGKGPKAPPRPVQVALQRALKNVTQFHKGRAPAGWSRRNAEGARVGERYDPYQRVGCYVPGGTAPLVSTALMTVAIAQIAGVKQIVVCTPPPVNPILHYAVLLAGATEVYQIGGAQAVAAMAYGTPTLGRVQKIFGPGNAYVVEAKRQVYGLVDIDLLPGPSEIAVLADKTARPDYIAADLLAQAEHGPGSRIFLVSPEAKLLQAVEACLEEQVAKLDRQAYLRETLNLGAHLVRVRNLREGAEVIERIAPEHVALMCQGAATLAGKLRNCGAVFIGDYSPVAAGDYAAGPSHTLPTGGAGKSFGGLRMEQFFRRTSVVHYERAALAKIRSTVETLAAVEGMGAHRASVAVRFTDKGGRKKK